MIVKAQQQGNSTILTVPKNIHIPKNTEFNVYQDNSGNIVYEPVTKNNDDLWSDTKLDDFDYKKIRHEELHDLGYNPRESSSVGKEKTND
ncbi:AbrB/MazE/SpoVT family DNA-binding domain-containing protein [Levilactobacillus tujiorum]|uniref:AbrB family toxin-antitoxin system antitoxin n=1 Tax=Levilactobacillus tujiorum TaxID=2912243 RepID=A0ABX1L6Q0_9LACO|nr:AbrB family toxin-antitoxin system antitoxin [Levilactobacillus tujiorum]MCH5464995.1 AbrB family toxin-antitoxin system antitoxin [Levilactobacillus tujiorum]NLR12054.1 AbrB family toxin-antitoxin system antitoxin [Lactobacillus sp. HBUAS51387]NLR30029.1 AbrB family toxin-antitoxin system antitoxin [Levilactobacillus tujiorum]